jgi:hypothetical protein
MKLKDQIIQLGKAHTALENAMLDAIHDEKFYPDRNVAIRVMIMDLKNGLVLSEAILSDLPQITKDRWKIKP